MKSIGQKIQQCAGLVGTRDVTEWEGNFLTNVVERTSNGTDTSALTAKQVDVVERLYQKHFA